MRRRERINEILEIIREKWEKMPELRLGQLLMTQFGYPKGSIFGVEDDIFGNEVHVDMKEKEDSENFAWLKEIPDFEFNEDGNLSFFVKDKETGKKKQINFKARR